MAQWLIPTSSDPFYVQTTALDGVDYLFTFAFNHREKCWYFSLATPDGAPLASGIKVVANTALLGARATEGLPGGELVAFTSSTDTSPPGLEELGEGKRCELLYLDAAGLAALAAA